jgi:hypothetical protein
LPFFKNYESSLSFILLNTIFSIIIGRVNTID